jgi:hypothetical protein
LTVVIDVDIDVVIDVESYAAALLLCSVALCISAALCVAVQQVEN